MGVIVKKCVSRQLSRELKWTYFLDQKLDLSLQCVIFWTLAIRFSISITETALSNFEHCGGCVDM